MFDRRSVLDYLKSVIDEDIPFGVQTFPNIRLFIMNDIAFRGTFSGKNMTICDPTIAQYAALMDRGQSLATIINLAGQAAPRLFCPKYSAWPMDILFLAIHSESGGMAALDTITVNLGKLGRGIDGLLEGKKWTALGEAVRISNYSAVRYLVERQDANPFAGAPHAFEIAVSTSNHIFIELFKVAMDKGTYAAVIRTPTWTVGSSSVSLEQYLVAHNFHEAAQAIRNRFNQTVTGTDTPAGIANPISPVLRQAVEEEEEDVAYGGLMTTCAAGDCEESESLERCDNCKFCYCTDHMADHVCRPAAT